MDVYPGSRTGGRQPPPLTIRTSRAPSGGDGDAWPPVAEEPVSPTARLMDGFYIVVTMGLGAPLNLPALRAGIETQLARYPRFRSIQVTTKDDDKPRWVRAPALNLDDHIVVVPSGPDLPSSDPDKAVEDYAASLSTTPMDRSRPMWEFHLLDFPTSDATSTVIIRVHHSLGDGISLLTLLMASTRSAADPSRLPAMPAPPARSGDIYARPRPPRSAGTLAFLAWLWSFAVLAWHTVVDVTLFVATIAFVRDPRTLFKRADIGGGERPRRKRFVNRSLSLGDVKFVKNSMNCTVNDVLVGVTSAALSRYYFRRSGDNNTRKISLRSILLVNIRPTTSLQAYVDMIESGNSDGVKWGNQLGYIILPFHIAMYEDSLDYVCKAKKIVDRKKSSLEVVFTHMLGEVIIKTLGVKAAGVIFHRMISHTSISFSNMIGPAEHVEFYGHPVVSIAPSAYGPPEALTVHYQSYSNTIKVILAVDEDHFPDHSQLLDDFTESLRIIKDGASLK